MLVLLKQRNDQSQTKETSVMILGDSMVKHSNGYEISRELSSKGKVYVRSVYLKLSLRKKPDHFILPVGTNYLNSERYPDLIAKSITDYAASLKNENHDASISNIIVHIDNLELREKALTVNKEFSEICRERNLYLIDKSKKIKQQHLNKGKLHLNQNGVRVLSDIYLIEIRYQIDMKQEILQGSFSVCLKSHQ